MAKEAIKYYAEDQWRVIENGFDPQRGKASESIYSLGNEYMGIRGIFDETYTGDRLVGSYYNGVFEVKPITYAEHFKGLSERCCFMINANNWLYTRIYLDGEELDLAKVDFSDFKRELNMREGILLRSFIFISKSGKRLKLEFERFVSMRHKYIGAQKITFTALNFSSGITVISGTDFTPLHMSEGRNFWEEQFRDSGENILRLACKTNSSGQRVFSSVRINQKIERVINEDKLIAGVCTLNLIQNSTMVFEKTVINLVEKDSIISQENFITAGRNIEKLYKNETYNSLKRSHIAYWTRVWDKLDITVEGDMENQQGIRFCIFNLHQTYHGNDPTLNVGAKGLTGEAYSGWTFWDTETYCLPFYMFNNPSAAKNLIMYRYHTLKQAKERAIEQDCQGACYPMVTIDGTESCGVWQHGNLEIHVTAAVAYAVWHYMKIMDDIDFLCGYGAELLIETSRYFASRGAYSPKNGDFGLWGVMGPDEFHMMVHNNVYTNYMVKKMFIYTLSVLNRLKAEKPAEYAALIEKTGYKDSEAVNWQNMAEKMRINLNKKTGLFEQHDGYFDMPEIDVKAIPADKVPVYKYWAYDSIFRYNMLKQPDIVLMQFFFSNDFSLKSKQVNYDYYEKRCSHESSLSPAVHSIMAAEIGNMQHAEIYSRHSSRLDLDDYNRNTNQGLHVTSMAATWMNVVYGFGGMRSDGEKLSFSPVIPEAWKSYTFKIIYKNSVLTVKVSKENAVFTLDKGYVKIKIYGKTYRINKKNTVIKI